MEGLKCWHRTSEGYLDIGTSVRRAYVHVYVSRGLPWTVRRFVVYYNTLLCVARSSSDPAIPSQLAFVRMYKVCQLVTHHSM
jgi:hypothetical protein